MLVSFKYLFKNHYLMITKEDFDWPGWPLDKNPYGKEFDLAARERMFLCSQLLLPLIKKHEVGEFPLEVGPFFNPLLTPELFSSSYITFMDNDAYVIKYLKQKYPETTVIYQDLNKSLPKNLPSYSSIVVSHLLNYIDYRFFLQQVPSLLSENGKFFLNNSPNYGLSAFFSPLRPKNNEETLDAIIGVGLEIIEYQLIPSPDKSYQPNERLLLIARK